VEAAKHKNSFLGPSIKSVKYKWCVQSLDANTCALFHQIQQNHRWYSNTFSKLAVEVHFEAAENQDLQQALNFNDDKFSNKHLSNSKRIKMSKEMTKILQHEEYSRLKIFCWSWHITKWQQQFWIKMMQIGKDDLLSIENKYFPRQLQKSFTKRKKKRPSTPTLKNALSIYCWASIFCSKNFDYRCGS